MTKEFLLECERKLAKSYVCTALGRDDDSIAITKEIAKDIAFEVTNSVHPWLEDGIKRVKNGLSALLTMEVQSC